MSMGKLYQLLEGRMKELALFTAPMPPLTYFTGFVDIILDKVNCHVFIFKTQIFTIIFCSVRQTLRETFNTLLTLLVNHVLPILIYFISRQLVLIWGYKF